ncbi:hypothetical protein ACLK1U_22415 [Escherichia coli]
MRKLRPSPGDEAKWGFAGAENSLWQGVPNDPRATTCTPAREPQTARRIRSVVDPLRWR